MQLIPYILLILIPILFLFVSFKYDCNNKKNVIVYGQSDFIKKNNIAIAVYFILYFILLSMRHTDIGNDTDSYRNHFAQYASLRFNEIFDVNFDTIYVLLNWVVSRFTNNFQVFLIVTSVIIVVPLFYIYSKDKEHSYIKLILFSTLTPFIMYFSGIRQGIAMSIGMIAYILVRRKRIVSFIIIVFIAMGFHHSAFILFFMYPVYYFTFKKKHLMFLIPLIVAVFVFNKPIFNYLTNLLSRFSDDYADVSIVETGAIGSLLLFIVFAVFCYAVPDETKMDREMIGLRNLLLFAVVLQCFTPLHSLAMRLNYYYILFIPMIIPKVLTVQRPGYRQIALWGSKIMATFFTLLYLYTLYTSYTTGVSTLNTIPYKFFWQ